MTMMSMKFITLVLQNNGNLTEFASWLDKDPTEELRAFIQANSFDCSDLSDGSGEGTPQEILSSHQTTPTASTTIPTPAVGLLKLKIVKSEATGSSCVAVATSAETTGNHKSSAYFVCQIIKDIPFKL